MPELGDVSASSSFDALLASDDSTASEVESELFAESEGLLDEDTLRQLQEELSLEDLDIESEEIERILEEHEEEEDAISRSASPSGKREHQPVRAGAFRYRPAQQTERVIARSTEPADLELSTVDLSFASSLFDSDSFVLTDTTSFPSTASTPTVIETRRLARKARSGERTHPAEPRQTPSRATPDTMLSDGSISTISPRQPADTPIDHDWPTPGPAAVTTKAGSRRRYSPTCRESSAYGFRAARKQLSANVALQAAVMQSQRLKAELDRLAHELQSSVVNGYGKWHREPTALDTERSHRDWRPREVHETPRLLPRLSAQSSSSILSPDSSDSSPQIDMAETEPSHAPDTWLENRVVDALVRKYLRADMIHHLIKRIDNDPLLQPSYRMNIDVARVPASLRLVPC